VARANELLAARKEEVLVKASGRAMEQAWRVGEWFRNKEKEFLCSVEVRSGSVSVVDDIVQADENEVGGDGEEDEHEDDNTRIEGGDTTLELFGAGTITPAEDGQSKIAHEQSSMELDSTGADTPLKKSSRRKRKGKRKRPVYEEEDLPEARLRWIKTVEVAISLQG